MIGCGTYAWRMRGMPFIRTTDWVTGKKMSVWTATVGTAYFPSMLIACTATAGAQVLQ
jgi:hypothetical protein